jgi:uncharacterized protein (TIGR03435 family)
MEDGRFDIEAKLPESAKDDRAHDMLQALLAERFGVELHHESRELAGFVLVVGKHGAKMEEFRSTAATTEPLSPEDLHETRKQQMEEWMKAMQDPMQERRKSGLPMARIAWSSWRGITTKELAGHFASMAGGPISMKLVECAGHFVSARGRILRRTSV